MTWEERVWGYTGAAGMIQGFATGYFMWDLMITLQNMRLFGLGMLAHALSALIVFSFGFVSALRINVRYLLHNSHVTHTETLCQLLRLHVHSLRTLLPVPELPLVFR